jgi:spore coat protein CotH
LALASYACGSDDPPKGANTGGQGGALGTGGAATTLGGCTSAECGPDVDSFFDNGKLATLRLTFDEAELKMHTDAEHPEGYSSDQWLDLLWNKWNNHCGPYEWIPARMEYESPDHLGDVTLERVSVRLRGTRSRGVNPLAGFKIDFTKSLPNSVTRRFAGLNRINVLSNERDDSNMVQCMGYKLMRDFGLPAPMCNHLRVYVNGKLYGLVESVERAKDARFLKHHFGTSDGPMYAASATCGFTDSLADLEYKGDTYDNGVYPGIYEILRGSSVDAEANLIPMMKCGDDVQTPSDDDFRACISDWIDVEQWLKVIAGESLIPSVEDFFGARRNFYLYFLPDAEAPHGGRMKVWGWDYDTVLQRSTCLPSNCDPFKSVANWYGPLGKRQKLVVRLTRVFKAEYCEQLNRFLAEVYDPSKVDAMASVIEPAMVDDPVISEEKWRAEVTRMREYMTKHATDMATVVEQACADVL